ncbi:MAG: aldehyde dehydrogenase family protein, partial [Gammaproteobacteria bacterium]|nr:aldehyde dehydrogenase family protein [Gammaproteobacteria bacterium]
MDQAVIDLIEKYGVTERTLSFLNAEKRHYINGKFVAGGEMMPVLEPCTGLLLAEVPSGTAAEIDAAVTAARHAFAEGEWSRWKPAQRERVLMKLADLVEENLQTLAEIESLDAGKA